ncbi:MAG: 30S ribosomal protein S18 [Deltaproteobacteria bacterium]|nr:30S ribosomal protein S18 [Deltaproteobacteria bacterium]
MRQQERQTERKDFQQKKKTCRFCGDPSLPIDYKDARALRPFITERGKVIPRRITGNCARHQRKVTEAIKRARVLALFPFTSSGVV